MFFSGEMGPLLVLSIILIAGLAGRALARRLQVPGLTGNLLAGILLGPACLNLFSGLDVATALRPLSTFAMALICVSIGSHLSARRLHNAWRRVIAISLGEVAGTVSLVTLATHLLGADWPTAFVIGSISAATSPATIVSLVREMRAKGPYVKTLLSVVALDDIFCIMLFTFSSTLLADFHRTDGHSLGLLSATLQTLWQFSGSLVLALVLGYFTEWLVRRRNTHDFSVVFIAILLSVGVSEYFALSPLLTGLFFGVYLGNASEIAVRQTQALEPIELLLFSCFFTVAGITMHLDSLAHAGLLCLAYFTMRYTGKFLGASLGGILSGASPRIWFNTGLGLMPEAAIAIGLLILLGADPHVDKATWVLIDTVVLGAVVINEIIGPVFTRLALRRAKEANKDRRRLIEFLQEEYILINLQAEDKWAALRKLNDFFVRTHRVPLDQKESLYQTIQDREKDFTTAVGRGAAIPHGRIEKGTGIRGVLGLCAEGIDWDAPDGVPVRIIMLVVTPKGYEKEHLEVMASLAQMISDDAIRTRLLAAVNANDAWEIIESEDTRNYNYFLEEKGAADA